MADRSRQSGPLLRAVLRSRPPTFGESEGPRGSSGSPLFRAYVLRMILKWHKRRCPPRARGAHGRAFGLSVGPGRRSTPELPAIRAGWDSNPRQVDGLEREAGFEPATCCLARSCSTPELLPREAPYGGRSPRGLPLTGGQGLWADAESPRLRISLSILPDAPWHRLRAATSGPGSTRIRRRRHGDARRRRRCRPARAERRTRRWLADRRRRGSGDRCRCRRRGSCRDRGRCPSRCRGRRRWHTLL